MKALVLALTSIFFAHIAQAQPDILPGDAKKIKILSWNIYMLPAFLGHGKSSRAEAIGRFLDSSDYDVIVFQEAFDGQARRILSRHLQPAFPFQAGPANHRVLSLKSNSGVWIFSKHPIRRTASITFKTRIGLDALSRKGALLVELSVKGQLVQIVGTHLQNAGSDWLRYSQCVELNQHLLEPFQRPGIPQIVCGDFNIDRYSNADRYHYMLQVLDASDGPLSGPQTYSYDRLANDLTSEPGDQRDLIDYILLRNALESEVTVERRIQIFRHPWQRRHQDLSDHFAVEASIQVTAPRSIVASR